MPDVEDNIIFSKGSVIEVSLRKRKLTSSTSSNSSSTKSGDDFGIFAPYYVDGEMDPLAYLPWSKLAAKCFFKSSNPVIKDVLE